ncbi:MAG: hypothetical protein WD045_00630 [Pirellulaceae bacterium]
MTRANPATPTNRIGLQSPVGRQLWLCVAVVAGFCIGSVALWNRHSERVADNDNFLLSAAEIRITQQPAWIHSDVRAESIAYGGLDEAIDIRDRRLTERVATAFAAHPWIRQVHRVAKQYPAKVVVQVEYREPVAMVEVIYDGARSLQPVDAEGIVLPTEDFAASQVLKYPRVNVGLQMTSSDAGQKWGDARVTEAAEIASLLGAHWEELKLARIALSDPSDSAEPAFVLETIAGDRIIWGSAPGRELPQETLAAQKVAVILDLATESAITQNQPDSQLDLRTAGRNITAATMSTRR